MNIESNATNYIYGGHDENSQNETGLDNLDNDHDVCKAISEPYEGFDYEAQHMEDVLTGYADLLSRDEVNELSVSGNEAYALSVLRIYGMESWTESIKKGAEAAYKAIVETLKKIKDFFFGDGEKRVEEADSKAGESVKAMAALDMNAPLQEESKAKNPLTFFKGLQESAELEKVFEKYPSVKTAMDKISASVGRVKDSETVGQLGAVYQDMRKSAAAAGTAISGSLRKALTEAEKKANAMRNPKTLPEDATAEMKAAAKEEHQAVVTDAREDTKETRVLAGLQNRIVSMLNAIGSSASSIKGEKKESEFKG